MTLFFVILFLIIGMLALYKGADLLVDHASSLAAKLGISTAVVGLTVVTIGTMMPEVFIAINSSIQGANDLIIGNALGTAVFSFGLILGVAALINPIAIRDSTLKHEFPWLMLFAVLIYLLAFDLTISRGDGIILLLLAVAFIWYSVKQSKKDVLEELGKQRVKERSKNTIKTSKTWFKIVLGVLLIIGGSKLFVDSALSIAEILDVSQLLIGLLVIAVGTSLPEMVTTLTASARHEPAVGVGNIIGSTTMNVFFIVGLASLINPIAIHPDLLIFDFPVVIFFTVLISVLFASSHKLTRFEGGLLVLGYIMYLVYSIKFWA
jgi:cation:H+ antiporter